MPKLGFYKALGTQTMTFSPLDMEGTGQMCPDLTASLDRIDKLLLSHSCNHSVPLSGAEGTEVYQAILPPASTAHS